MHYDQERLAPPFNTGDRVLLSESARGKAKHPMRRGVVVGVSGSGTQVRVLWDGLLHAQLIHCTLIVHTDNLGSHASIEAEKHEPA